VVKGRLDLNPSYLPRLGKTDAVREAALDLPITNYKYLRITIYDSLTPPVSIREVGFYDFIPARTDTLASLEPMLKPLSWKGPRQSAWTLDFDLPNRPDGLNLWFEAGPDFYRHFQVLAPIPAQKGKKADTLFLAEGYVSSAKEPFPISLDGTQARRLLLVVDNGDSPPLHLLKAKAWLRNLALLAYMKPEVRYWLLFGNDTLPAPEYDLAAARPRIKPLGRICQVSPYERLAHPPALAPAKLAQSYTQVYLWAGIVVLAGLLVWMAVSLMKDMQKKV
jgi:hypothetical protein